MARPTKDEYYLKIALEVAQRGTCLRRVYGAVIVNNDKIVSTGYNGAPRGTPNCIDLGKCYRKEKKIPSGQHYELCRSVHAEANAVIHAAYEQMNGGKMYIACQVIETEGGLHASAGPCMMCQRLIINAGIKEIIFRDASGNIVKQNVNDWLKKANENPFEDVENLFKAS